MKNAIIERWMFYFSGSVIALVLLCMVVCQTERDEKKTKNSSVTQKPSSWKALPTKDIQTGKVDRLKTPDELYEEQHNQISVRESTEMTFTFDGQDIVPPKLIELEENVRKNDQMPYIQDTTIIPQELEIMEDRRTRIDHSPIKQDSNIIPKYLGKLEKKSAKHLNAPQKHNKITSQDTKVDDAMPEALQMIEIHNKSFDEDVSQSYEIPN